LKYKKYWQVYEFHPDYAKITAFQDVKVKKDGGEFINRIRPASISLYEAEDAYSLACSNNIKIVSREGKLDRWRGLNYESLGLELAPNYMLKKGEPFAFWFSYMVNILPHLHTMDPIKPGKKHHLGINVKPCSLEKNYRVIALPTGTEIHSVFSFLPTKEIKTEEWIYFIYDVTGIKNNVSLHVKFTLTSDSPQVKIQDINAMLHEMN